MLLAIILKYWREIAIGAAVCLLIAAAIYVRSVFTERDSLKAQNAVLAARLLDAADALQLTNRVTEAINQLQARSTANVNRIEHEEKPRFVDSRPLAFIPGGLLQSVYSSPAAGGSPSGHASGGSLPAVLPAGRVLSR